MHIFYIHQYFVTPSQGGATRSYHLAKGMVAKGLMVDMITAHQESFYDFKIIDGIRVHYLPVNYSQTMGFLRRIWAFLRFVVMAKRLIRKLPRPDYLYVTSTPLTTGLIALWAKKKFAIPYIFEVRDLWPDAPIEIGVIQNPLLQNYLWALEKKIYRQALKTVALSPGIANAIRQKVPSAEVHVVPNFADLNIFHPQPKCPKLLQKFGLKDTFTIIYAGAIGKVNALHELLDLAEATPYQFLIMGEGSELPTLQNEARQRRLSNLRFIPFGPKTTVNKVMSCADMACILFERSPIFKTNSPNKFFDALAMGKAILTNQKGWIGELVHNQELGIYHDCTKLERTLQQLEEIAQEPKALKKMQYNSRQLAERYFNAENAVSKILHVIDPDRFTASFNDEVYIRTA
ncbi:glycosyltransferase family 4 protein [Mongoliitalea daihaiensis]|uniref:glycosyltransferase family 4 protein n=1 Tax=Mongoliitalea daihaiensis TaxID=2782006 RepID=UPI001F1C17CB|nr:glycosyltransferase family 4 protein [Mongoliitalea daihaiensis]UJP65987.1 glycosyltransferase family 4 protein [Mongoliitalea daihaiensis]